VDILSKLIILLKYIDLDFYADENSH